jgi:hypothetical protein
MLVPPSPLLLVALALAPDSSAVPRDTARVQPPRIVRRLPEMVVRAPLHDVRSSESVHVISARLLRTLPADGLTEALALKAGVVARGEQLHVRGGRAGEMSVLLEGIRLNEPQRDRAPGLPLLAVRSAELVSGGFDAEYGGALAGVLDVRTVDPGGRWSGEALWRTDGRRDTRYDRVGARLGGPVALGYGAVATAEVSLDDTYLPALRTQGRQRLLGGSWGWRADNRLLGHLKLAPVAGPQGFSLQVLASRSLEEPYDPMWSLDGWTTPCDDPQCKYGPRFSPTPQPGYQRYRAADHLVMTEERRVATVLSFTLPRARDRMSAALGFSRARAITSLGARDDESYLGKGRAPIFGLKTYPGSDPFLVYGGDEPYFRRSASATWRLRADYSRWTPRGSGGKAGFGATYDEVELRELDVSTRGLYLDSLRTYHAFAPGAFAYVQGRWVFEGMVLNAGLRGELFSAGPQAERQAYAARTPAVWSVSPRLGVAYPISVRDVFSLSYARVQQNPARDFLYENRLNPNNYRPLGNPAIQPATMISWQGAVKHLFNERWALQLALFYRDLWGEVGARNFTVPYAPPHFRYAGEDEGHASGYELSLLRSGGEHVHLELHYTWQVARGSESLEDGIPFYVRAGMRPVPIGEHPLDWDRRHAIGAAASWESPGRWALAWSTRAGSGLPWTPAKRRQLEADLSSVNTRNLGWEESSALSARWWPPRIGPLSVGLEVRNVFDTRSEAAATVNGYPQLEINTAYDDYGAFRTETGLPGGAYWLDRVTTGEQRWVRVNDPRLLNPPRTVRLSLGAAW